MTDSVVGCGLALAHPERLAILRELRAGRYVSGRLYAERNPSARQNRAAYHLRTLVGVGAAEPTVADPFDHTTRGRRHKLYVFEGETTGRLGDLLDVSSGSLMVVDPKGGEAVPFKLKDHELMAIGKAISHPMRLRMIRDLRGDGDWSPTTWASANGETLGDSSYHFKQLARFKVAKVAWTEKRRGAVEHFYKLTAARSQAALAVLDVLEARAELVAAEHGDGSKGVADTSLSVVR
ncbi:MAG: helix-turn-helix transcriptional regulator [Actinobacteria bacterium]|nr:helix-turn-helix transcriptional regulator [Actinomycetota bacterium]